MREGWEYKKLGEVCDIYQPRTLATEQLVEDGKYYVYGANGIIGRYNEYNHEQEEILLTCRGATCGTINVSEPYSWINGNAMVIHRKTDDLSFGFLRYLMLSLDYSLIISGAAQPQITRQKLSPTAISYPPLSIQQSIVSELDEINNLLSLKRKELETYDKLAQSIFYEMFGDPVENEKGWEVKKLGDNVKEMFLGPFGSALKTDCYVEKSEAYAMVYEQKHAIRRTLEQDNHYIDKDKFDSLSRFEILPGDFIMSCRGTIGKIYRIPYGAPKGILHPSLMKIRIKDAYNPVLFEFLLSKIIVTTQTNGNCVQMAITASNLAKMQFILPPLPLQQLFAERIEAIEAQKVQVKAAIEKLERLLAARMQYWFD